MPGESQRAPRSVAPPQPAARLIGRRPSQSMQTPRLQWPHCAPPPRSIIALCAATPQVQLQATGPHAAPLTNRVSMSPKADSSLPAPPADRERCSPSPPPYDRQRHRSRSAIAPARRRGRTHASIELRGGPPPLALAQSAAPLVPRQFRPHAQISPQRDRPHPVPLLPLSRWFAVPASLLGPSPKRLQQLLRSPSEPVEHSPAPYPSEAAVGSRSGPQLACAPELR
mmetsp:Transcript_47124/g.123671  ORF Transcript_47124/g.123671 Transcript_47124/m.123671 type:complete len:226 (-) Transcript_47124:1577-2254(-)